MAGGNNNSVCEENNYRSLYNSYALVVRNFVYYRCGNLSKAEDVMQESFIKLWENCSVVIFEKAKSYLFTVANRLFINEYNHNKVVLSFEKENNTQQYNESPEFVLEEKEFKQRLEGAIASLTDGQREVFLMNRIDKLPYKEIAAHLGVSVKAVEKRMHNALLSLKNNVEELEKYKI